MQHKTPQIPAVAWACELIQHWHLLSLSRISVWLGNMKKWARKQRRICFCFRRLFGVSHLSAVKVRFVKQYDGSVSVGGIQRSGPRKGKKNKNNITTLFDTAALHTLIRSTSAWVCARSKNNIADNLFRRQPALWSSLFYILITPPYARPAALLLWHCSWTLNGQESTWIRLKRHNVKIHLHLPQFARPEIELCTVVAETFRQWL